MQRGMSEGLARHGHAILRSVIIHVNFVAWMLEVLKQTYGHCVAPDIMKFNPEKGLSQCTTHGKTCPVTSAQGRALSWSSCGFAVGVRFFPHLLGESC